MSKITSRQDEVYEFIKNFLCKYGYSPTVREIGDHFGFSANAAHGHIRTLKNKGKLNFTPRISRSITLLDEAKNEAPEILELPVLGNIAAGLPIFSEENWDGKVQIPVSLLYSLGKTALGDFFALRVQGDSMIGAGILDGDLVIIKHQNMATNGQIVAAKTSEGGVTLKYFNKEANRYRLDPANDDYPSIYMGEVQILGLLKIVLRSY